MLSNIIDANLHEGKSTFIAFVDMKKAFDWVNRDLLWYILQEYHITGKILNAIK